MYFIKQCIVFSFFFIKQNSAVVVFALLVFSTFSFNVVLALSML